LYFPARGSIFADVVNQRKEVIQCLIRNAVTSLGSPDSLTWSFGASAPWPASLKERRIGSSRCAFLLDLRDTTTIVSQNLPW